MSELLPIHITPDTHPYAIKLSRCYSPHTPIPSRQELLENQYDIPPAHCSLKGLTSQCGYEYDKEIKRRR